MFKYVKSLKKGEVIELTIYGTHWGKPPVVMELTKTQNKRIHTIFRRMRRHHRRFIGKVCDDCGEYKTVDKFIGSYYRKFDGTITRGYVNFCKKCRQVRYGKRNSEYAADRYDRRKAQIVKIMGDKCGRCKQTFPLCCYDMHHKDHPKKPLRWFEIKDLSWKEAVKELKKCVLRCACCHRMEHMRLVWASDINP